MEFHAFHGVYESEKETGNKFIVDVTIQYPFEDVNLRDRLAKTINYERVYAITKQVMSKPANLIEQVALTIAERVTEEFPAIQSVSAKVSKCNPPIEGNVKLASAEATLP